VGEGRVSFHHPDIFDDRAVARINPHAVDLDRTGGGHEIPVTVLAKGIVNGFTDLQRSAQHARLSADWQRLIVVIEAARASVTKHARRLWPRSQPNEPHERIAKESELHEARDDACQHAHVESKRVDQFENMSDEELRQYVYGKELDS
jgi:hypothetical protein